MPTKVYVRPTKSVLPPFNPLLAPQPPIAPLTPPVHVVDLMTPEGSAVFGATWRGTEAKLVECPALSDSRPEFKTTYDVEPHAELLGFDDSAWVIMAPDDLGGRRGGGMISFFWYRTTLTIPVEATDFATDGAKAVLRVNVDDYAEIWVNGEMPRAAGKIGRRRVEPCSFWWAGGRSVGITAAQLKDDWAPPSPQKTLCSAHHVSC
jgi:hypothetical protein